MLAKVLRVIDEKKSPYIVYYEYIDDLGRVVDQRVIQYEAQKVEDNHHLINESNARAGAIQKYVPHRLRNPNYEV